MEKQELEVQKRWKAGKGVARKLRATGLIPAICYRKGLEPISLSMEKRRVERLLQGVEGQSVLVQLKILDEQGAESQESVILKEIQKDHFSEIIHVDFLAVKMDEVITVEVPLKLIGEPKEALREGGMIQQLRRVLEVECLPGEIPEHMDVDISDLNMGDTLHVENVIVAEGIRVLTDEKEAVVVISAPVAEEVEEVKEEEEEGAEEAGEKPAETPEGEEKKEEESK